ncbi:UPF0171 family protein [Tieghemostelium lacteum]|uniref:UPF0171 family protein n=1 Tax=Tieghemostelium lacteum TaxID=361077 RepID=A0A151Z9C5_TIELA|nr:UPF0171 family protein [Tieghemostelium lacteum]|eukprot:KYQ90548.1 UPF0171 family protein [Tieghemostelium lacteum]
MLGIILVVHTSIGGDKLIFRYPTVTRSKVSDETLKAFKQQHPLTTMNPNQPGLNKSSNETDQSQQDQSTTSTSNLKDKYFIYNLPSVVITPILTPKQRLCDQSFELTIENTTFVGHPTLLSNNDQDDNTASHHQSLRESTNRSDKKEGQLLPTHTLKESLNNSNNNNNSSSSNSGGNGGSRTQPICEDRPKGVKSKTGVDDKNYHDEITLFNIVFVISARNRELSQQKVLDSFKRISMQLAAALKHEQLRCNYITDQVHEMLAVREKWLTEQTSVDITSPPPPQSVSVSSSSQNSSLVNNDQNSQNKEQSNNSSSSNVLNSPTSNHKDLTDRILARSSLAREIRDIFNGLTEKGVINVRINKWINIHSSLNNPDHYPLYPVRTYHALLPFTGNDSIPLPMYDSSPSLMKLLEVARPVKSFRDLQLETDIPLAQIYRLASHLVYWKKAKIINMMTKNNYYVLSPSSNNSFDYIELNKKFTILFPDFKLPDILQRFSTARPLSDHISKFLNTHHSQFLQVVGWLLQHDLILQLYTFIHLIIPLPNNNMKSFNNNNNIQQQQQQQQQQQNININLNNQYSSQTNLLYQPPVFPLVPSQLGVHEKTFFENIDDKTKSYQLFKRLSPYFRGLHHIEEIMWRENISRDELNKILKKYKNVLVQVIHESPFEMHDQ